jgi:hypothetical protein
MTALWSTPMENHQLHGEFFQRLAIPREISNLIIIKGGSSLDFFDTHTRHRACASSFDWEVLRDRAITFDASGVIPTFKLQQWFGRGGVTRWVSG